MTDLGPLDEKERKIIDEIRAAKNLSSDQKAIKFLMQRGYKAKGEPLSGEALLKQMALRDALREEVPRLKEQYESLRKEIEKPETLHKVIEKLPEFMGFRMEALDAFRNLAQKEIVTVEDLHILGAKLDKIHSETHGLMQHIAYLMEDYPENGLWEKWEDLEQDLIENRFLKAETYAKVQKLALERGHNKFESYGPIIPCTNQEIMEYIVERFFALEEENQRIRQDRRLHISLETESKIRSFLKEQQRKKDDAVGIPLKTDDVENFAENGIEEYIGSLTERTKSIPLT